MNSEEFDIQIKELLQDAEERVSPAVWEGVEAGLNKYHRLVFWRRSAVAVAAAAAVAGAFVFLEPDKHIQEHSNPTTISVAEAQVAGTPLRQQASPAEETAAPAEPLATRRSRLAAIPSGTLAGTVALPAAANRPVAQHRRAIGPDNRFRSGVEDAALLNRLAFSDRRSSKEKGLSLLASGLLEARMRNNVNPGGRPMRFAAPVPIGAGEGIYNEQPETSFMLPFSLGVGAKYNFTSRLALGLGLRYTNLSRTFVGDFVSSDGIMVPQTDIDNAQHWLGIPLNFYYDVVNRGRWRVHAFAGGSAEFLADDHYLVHYSPKDLHYHKPHGTLPQWSVAGGLGVEFKLTPAVGLYLDPAFRYYFDTAQQPRSLRTIQPLRFDIEAGLRFSFGSH